MPNKEWPQVFEFIFSGIQDSSKQTHALTLLSVVIEYIAVSDIDEHFDNIHNILEQAIQAPTNDISALGILAVTNLAKATTNVKVLENF